MMDRTVYEIAMGGMTQFCLSTGPPSRPETLRAQPCTLTLSMGKEQSETRMPSIQGVGGRDGADYLPCLPCGLLR